MTLPRARFFESHRFKDLSGDQKIAFLGVPIKLAGEAIGVLTADRDMGDYQGHLEHDVRLLRMVAQSGWPDH